MKQMFLTMAIVSATLSAGAIEKLDWKTATEAQYRAALAEILSKTNHVELTRAFSDSEFVMISRRKDLDALRAEADEAFLAKGYCIFLWPFRTYFPKASALGRTQNGAVTNLSYSISLAERLNAFSISPYALTAAGADIGEMSKSMGEYAVAGIYGDIRQITLFKTYIQKSAAKNIKRKLREQGKSFVTKDGVNPVEQYMTRLNAALNAPRFAGLNEWLQSLGYRDGIDLSKLPSEEELAALKDAVMYGEKDMTEKIKVCLYVCLGVDGYNQFVKEYNGDK